MKLDEMSRLSASITDENPQQKLDQLKQKVEEKGMNWKELYQELEMSRRYVDAYRHESMESGQVPLHSHGFYELIYFRNNCGMEYLLGSERYSIQKGDLVLAPPGVNHQPILASHSHIKEPCRCDMVWMSREFVSKLASTFPFPFAIDWQKPILLRTAGTSWELLGNNIHASVEEAMHRLSGWEAVVAGNTVVLLTLLARAISSQEDLPLAKAEEPQLLEQMLAYIESHLEETITLASVAKRFWVSESKISQTFRQKLGISFYRYVIQRRLITAQSLILNNVPLNEVHKRSGFTDYSSFFRAFKQAYGISPSEFRKLHAKESPEKSATD